jgi:hypothetical protein
MRILRPPAFLLVMFRFFHIMILPCICSSYLVTTCRYTSRNARTFRVHHKGCPTSSFGRVCSSSQLSGKPLHVRTALGPRPNRNISPLAMHWYCPHISRQRRLQQHLAFRGSITRHSCLLSTLRALVTLTRKTRLQLLVRLCCTGLSPVGFHSYISVASSLMLRPNTPDFGWRHQNVQ